MLITVAAYQESSCLLTLIILWGGGGVIIILCQKIMISPTSVGPHTSKLKFVRWGLSLFVKAIISKQRSREIEENKNV